ncbi:MAG: DUF302 domain-containing protein [Zoogloeaceae bacterium]|nr:DUF302 domain-containing protein [Rhodocyclaceae bacterium]MCP5238117.1 DUF302 domain-containing protein [Zoogloeaceae bacterium]
MRIRNRLLSILLCVSPLTHAADGLIVVESTHPPAVTMDRLEAAATAKGMKVFARIDHAAGARSIGSEMQPTELLIFGNPKGGTPFMACARTVAIDLPLKAVVWQDEAGKVWLGYNDPAWIAARHDAGDCPVAANIAAALKGLAAAATAP